LAVGHSKAALKKTNDYIVGDFKDFDETETNVSFSFSEVFTSFWTILFFLPRREISGVSRKFHCFVFSFREASKICYFSMNFLFF